ncbi:3-carboxymuconate cyclase [Amycolatopsis antarctica]|uniref:3-carboxymuconate cyclase n=1 Tax=Amycolatopsis antarctica TaxID=1854586 RepID=A0A263CVD8_9PSEU|nr:lactonase family protein [Amycolatopsis antarctica]OZM70090.1 3-carboxymuconate cyclase [Amycolatopsis antarctica]
MEALDRRRFLGVVGVAAAAGTGLVLGGGTAAAQRPWNGSREDVVAYIGSYSTGDGTGAGLQLASRTADGPALTAGAAVEGVPDASFLAFSADRTRMYATCEQDPGVVAALDVSDPAAPRVLNSVPSGGAAPTHLSVHPDGAYLFTANYGSGTVAVHPIDGDGALGEVVDVVTHTAPPGKQPNAHQVLTDPSGGWVLAVDLGADSVFVYAFDPAAGTLTEHQRVRMPEGAGPRHLAFGADGRFAYVLGELRAEITVAAWDSGSGTLTPGAVVPTVPEGSPQPQYPSEIALCGDGRFAYVANRNVADSTISTFAVRDGGAGLERVGQVSSGGEWPRHLTLDPGERWVYVSNQRAGNVSWLPRDPETGLLGEVAGSVPVPSAAITLFV